MGWFTAWINAMCYFVIACSTCGIGAILLVLTGHDGAAFVVGNLGPVLIGLPALYLDYRRLTRA